MATAVQAAPSSTPVTPMSGPLAEAAVKLGNLLRQLTSERAHPTIVATVRTALNDVLDGAREQGTAQREVARLQRYTERLERANSQLSEKISVAHADREQLVRDLAPALDVMCDVFNRARELRDSLAPSSTPYKPTAPAPITDALTEYRELPVEAHTGD